MKLGKIFGVSLRLNKFFLALLFLYITFGVLPKGLIAFGTVLLHEMAHVIVARSYGMKVREVELLPFGGVARIEGNMELDPHIETYIALAGPISNLFLIILAYVMLELGLWNVILTEYFIRCNIIIGAFNLLPAVPLDGGRIYRAKRARIVGLKNATASAATMGQGLAVVLTLLGLAGQVLGYNTINVVIVAVFLFFAATRERKNSMFLFVKHMTNKKAELDQKKLLPGHSYVVRKDTPLKEVVGKIVPQKFLIVYLLNDNYQVDKILTENELIKGMLENGINTPIGNLISAHTKK